MEARWNLQRAFFGEILRALVSVSRAAWVLSEACERFLQLLNENVLMSKQGVGVGKVGAHLNCPLEEFDCIFVLFLMRETVATSTPGGCGGLVEPLKVLSQS